MSHWLFIVALPLLMGGCASLTSETTREVSTNPTNGVVTVIERTEAHGRTFLDANASFMKFYNRSGYATNSGGTFAPGTYAAGVNESSSSTNLDKIVQAVTAGAVQGAAAAMKP